MTGTAGRAEPRADRDRWLSESRLLQTMASVEAQARAADLWWTPQTSLMDVLGLARDEVSNCMILAWALNPAGRHRLGAHLLHRLLAHLGRAAEIADCRQATVLTEVSRLESRADIVITMPGQSPVVIEAKLSAREGVEQCARIEGDWPDAVYVFLTPAGRSPRTSESAEAWICMTWRWFLDEITEELNRLIKSGTIEVDATTAQARRALAQWAEGARRSLS